MQKDDLLVILERERSAWNELLAHIDPQRMQEPGAAGQWSVKDLIAHISWYEWEIAGALRTRTLGGSALWEKSPEERNQAIYEQHQGQSLEMVLADSRRAYHELLEAVAGLPEGALNDPGRMTSWPEALPPWRLLAENSYEHYRDHRAELEQWLAAGAA
jgi:uncharacterized protein (TIGR03083 family)